MRQVHKTLAFDCVRNPCSKNGCGTDPDSSHGVGSEVWGFTYAGPDEAAVIELSVASGVFLPITPPYSPATTALYPMPQYLTLHIRFPVTGGYARTCAFYPDGKCYSGDDYTTYIGADEFFRAHYDRAAGETQPESFWQPLEAKYAEWVEQAQNDRVPTAG